MKKELPIPNAAVGDDAAVELMRVWIAEKKLQCALYVGMYRESGVASEDEAWGIILADAARHVSNAMKQSYGEDPEAFLRSIRDSFNRELDKPTSTAEGDFV